MNCLQLDTVRDFAESEHAGGHSCFTKGVH